MLPGLRLRDDVTMLLSRSLNDVIAVLSCRRGCDVMRHILFRALLVTWCFASLANSQSTPPGNAPFYPLGFTLWVLPFGLYRFKMHTFPK